MNLRHLGPNPSTLPNLSLIHIFVNEGELKAQDVADHDLPYSINITVSTPAVIKSQKTFQKADICLCVNYAEIIYGKKPVSYTHLKRNL